MSDSYEKVRSGRLMFKGEEKEHKKKKKAKKEKRKEKKAQKRKLDEPAEIDEKLHGGWYQVCF